MVDNNNIPPLVGAEEPRKINTRGSEDTLRRDPLFRQQPIYKIDEGVYMLPTSHGGTLTAVLLTRGAALTASLMVSRQPEPPDRFTEMPIQVVQTDARRTLLLVRTVETHRFPRLACSSSSASKSALKLPLPKLWLPRRQMISKKSVGRSWSGLVNSCSR